MASKSNSGDTEPASYTSMSVGDVEAIGAHCQMAFCHQLDFLPFRCESCKGTFCLDHRTENAHKCANEGAWARARRAADEANYRPTPKPSLLNHEQQCSSPSCKTLINTALTPGVHCTTCNRHYCLKHRMGEDHDCKNLKPLGARPQDNKQAISREKGLAALEKLRAWGLAKKQALTKATSSVTTSSSTTASSASPWSSTKPVKNTPATRAAALNKLKASAKGDASVPVDKRIYLHVEASADTTKAKFPTGDFYYNKEWTVGRLLDAAAKALQVENINNRGGGEEQRLRVFHVEGGRLLEFSEKVGTCCQSGNTVVLLRGVGPAVPDLIEA